MNRVSIGLFATTTFIGHEIYTYNRLERELLEIERLTLKANEYLDKADPNHYIFVSLSEKEVFEYVIEILEGEKDDRLNYNIFWFSPGYLKDNLDRKLWMLFYYDDGDFYETFCEFAGYQDSIYQHESLDNWRKLVREYD